MHVLHVVGARPNFMKAAPVLRALTVEGVDQRLVHTGQHYDAAMSEVFFQELGLPEPDVNLGVGSGTHAMQTAQIMLRFEPLLLQSRPDWVLVYGDVNSTVAAALVCAKLLIRVAHVEAGLRSGDRTMPEEINRVLTDQLADLLFTPSPDGDEHLRSEGISPSKICRVGNVMIDTLVRLLPAATGRWPDLRAALGLHDFALLTLHRPSNVDRASTLAAILSALAEVSLELPVIFPVHPRTRERLGETAVTIPARVRLVEPMSYLDFLALQAQARFVITDSGGIQEETTYLGIPCLTLRENTERPVTVTIGTNRLVGRDYGMLAPEARAILRGHGKRGKSPPLWDGHAAERVAEILLSHGV